MNLSPRVLALAVLLFPFPLFAQEHSQHAAPPQEVTQQAPEAAAAPAEEAQEEASTPMDAMEKKMIKMELRMERQQKRMEKVQASLSGLQGEMAAIQALPAGPERDQRLAAHRQAMRAILKEMRDMVAAGAASPMMGKGMDKGMGMMGKGMGMMGGKGEQSADGSDAHAAHSQPATEDKPAAAAGSDAQAAHSQPATEDKPAGMGMMGCKKDGMGMMGCKKDGMGKKGGMEMMSGGGHHQVVDQRFEVMLSLMEQMLANAEATASAP